jgi:hypothetical protein
VLQLIDDIWSELAALCKAHRVERLDILTGFLGSGASRALDALGVRARIIVGLASETAALGAAQIAELAQLRGSHEVRALAGLHAKLYLLDERIVIVGSANFTRSGFERLDELSLATDDATVVRDAIAVFATRWEQAFAIDPNKLAPRTSSEGDELGSALGTAWDDRTSGFSPEVTPSLATASDPAVAGGEVFFVNVGEGPHRCWADCVKYGFLSAGQVSDKGRRFSDDLAQLYEGAEIYAYLVGCGYVGRGIVTGTRRMVKDHVVAQLGTPLLELPLQVPNIRENCDDPEKSEWIVPVTWTAIRSPENGVLRSGARRGHVVCRLRDPELRAALRAAFEA